MKTVSLTLLTEIRMSLKEMILKMGYLLIMIFIVLNVFRISHKYIAFSNATLNLKCSCVHPSVTRPCYFSITGERPEI